MKKVGVMKSMKNMILLKDEKERCYKKYEKKEGKFYNKYENVFMKV